MTDHVIHYGMILLDADPTLLRVRGQPMFFRSADETLEYAHLHGITRWMVYAAAPMAGGPPTRWTAQSIRCPSHPRVRASA